MTAQIGDQYKYCGNEYTIVTRSDPMPFHPSEYGIIVYRKPLARRVVPKKANGDDEKITPSDIVEVRSGNCKLQHRGRSFKNERHKQFISYEMELQIPHRICAEISAQSILWRETQRDRKNTEAAM